MKKAIEEIVHVLPFAWIEKSPYNIEKFADMIVQECIDSIGNTEDEGINRGLELAKKKIKEKFEII